MTHLHTDHAGGLHHFPDNEILVSRDELEYAGDYVGVFAATRTSAGPPGFAPRRSTCRPIGSAPSQRAWR
jgi:glyoxylase-like metal-dependent hydrolase (beta-lactamase superfamily II)